MGKLTYEAKTDILRLLNDQKTNPEIVEYLQKEYNVQVTEQYISRIRNKVNYYLVAHNTNAIAKLLKKRNMLEKESLDTLAYAMHTVKQYLRTNMNDFSVKNVKISLEVIRTIKELYELMESKNKSMSNVEQNLRLEAGADVS